MTAIAGYVNSSGIYLGSDSRITTKSGIIFPSNANKIFSRDAFTFGFSGTYRILNIIEHCFFPKDNDKISNANNVYNFTTSLSNIITKHGVNLLDEDSLMGLILIYKKEIYNISHSLSIIKINQRFFGEGCADIVLASMETYEMLSNKKIKETEKYANDIITTAINVAMKYDNSVGGDINIVKVS